jgi:flagellar basal-body rod protein FlgF
MDRGLYIAASGMIADQVRQDQIANDLANVSTTGYKADRSAQRSFGDMLLSERDTGQTVGHVSLGTEIAEIRTNLAPAPLKQTDEPLDVAIDGPGFLAVKTAAGTRFTRDGQLSMGADGTLETATGDPVLGADGQPLKLAGQGRLEIAADGTLTTNGQPQGKLALVDLTGVAKQGATLFTGTPTATAPANTTIRQGFLEGSGVNTAQAMVDMMTSMRAYESVQRVIHAIDDSLGRGIQAAATGS